MTVLANRAFRAKEGPLRTPPQRIARDAPPVGAKVTTAPLVPWGTINQRGLNLVANRVRRANTRTGRTARNALCAAPGVTLEKMLPPLVPFASRDSSLPKTVLSAAHRANPEPRRRDTVLPLAPIVPSALSLPPTAR